jgi:predicted GH43/DUF377 family glycosyl hydrolase
MQGLIERKETIFYPDPSRIIARFLFTDNERASNTIRSVMEMSEEDVSVTLKQTLRDYSMRHRNISKIFQNHYRKIAHLISQMEMDPDSINDSRRMLIGSYFTLEYSIESAAFFNPSIIEHPDQKEIGPGQLRVILSFRATGEGHISSIVFRTGVLDAELNLTLQPAGKMLEEAEHIRRHIYDKASFKSKLDEMKDFQGIIPSGIILDKLGDTFTYGELRNCIEKDKKTLHLAAYKEVFFNQIMWLASSHYELEFSLDTNISERVIFPVSVNEKNGIEDARFVKFSEDNGEIKYYATYTAFDGHTILPKMLETSDFYHFKISPLHGEIAVNKGMALFPRKIKGKYVMLCRLDGYNNYIAFSDQLTVWREAKLLQKPKYPWEFIQIGNCGSPIETEAGWLVITHGVGPMREYVLGASLFDIHHPEKEIGRLKNPLLIPNSKEREGYVPNVVYSCGSMVHNGHLIIPYTMSDYASTYATIHLNELLIELNNSG